MYHTVDHNHPTAESVTDRRDGHYHGTKESLKDALERAKELAQREGSRVTVRDAFTGRTIFGPGPVGPERTGSKASKNERAANRKAQGPNTTRKLTKERKLALRAFSKAAKQARRATFKSKAPSKSASDTKKK